MCWTFPFIDTVCTQAISLAGRQADSQPASPPLPGLLGLLDPAECWKRPFAEEFSSVYLKDRVIPSLSMCYYTK